MKYYVFEHGTLKLDGIELSDTVLPKLIGGITEVSRTKFYKIKTQESSKKALDKVKSTYEATKRKAVNIAEAIKK